MLRLVLHALVSVRLLLRLWFNFKIDARTKKKSEMHKVYSVHMALMPT
jgi:hypothetical protein